MQTSDQPDEKVVPERTDSATAPRPPASQMETGTPAEEPESSSPSTTTGSETAPDDPSPTTEDAPPLEDEPASEDSSSQTELERIGTQLETIPEESESSSSKNKDSGENSLKESSPETRVVGEETSINGNIGGAPLPTDFSSIRLPPADSMEDLSEAKPVEASESSSTSSDPKVEAAGPSISEAVKKRRLRGLAGKSMETDDSSDSTGSPRLDMDGNYPLKEACFRIRKEYLSEGTDFSSVSSAGPSTPSDFREDSKQSLSESSNLPGNLERDDDLSISVLNLNVKSMESPDAVKEISPDSEEPPAQCDSPKSSKECISGPLEIPESYEFPSEIAAATPPSPKETIKPSSPSNQEDQKINNGATKALSPPKSATKRQHVTVPGDHDESSSPKRQLRVQEKDPKESPQKTPPNRKRSHSESAVEGEELSESPQKILKTALLGSIPMPKSLTEKMEEDSESENGGGKNKDSLES